VNQRNKSARLGVKRALAPFVLAGLAAGLAFAATAPAQPQALKTPSECTGTANGAPWSYKGQHGTAYTVLGVNGASCTTGLRFMSRWTRTRASFDLKPVPAGWHCSAIGDYRTLSKLGQCTTSKGGIFEWLPKLKR
jgi:hypothetical protein